MLIREIYYFYTRSRMLIFLGPAFFYMISSWYSTVGAEPSVSNHGAIFFGNIIADPVGDVIEIDASSGPAVPRVSGGGRSFVSGGSSGLIQVHSDEAGQEIELIYPVSIELTGGSDSITLDEIPSHSIDYVKSTEVGTIDFHIGGLLRIPAGQPGHSYTGSMSVTVQLNNP